MIPTAYAERLAHKGYSHEKIQANWDYAQFVNNFYSPENGQAILDYCHQKQYTGKVTFHKWSDGYVVGKDEKQRQVLVIGGFFNAKFVLRARSRYKSMKFFCNGQASTNSIQLAHIAEQDFVPFPIAQQAWELAK